MAYQSPWDENTQTLQMPYNPNWQQNIQTTSVAPGTQGSPSYQQTQPVPFQSTSPPQTQGGNPFSAGMSADQVRQGVIDYFNSRNTQPQGNSVDYWTQKWGEFGNNDPNYFYQRLSQADEFGGGAGGAGGGMGSGAYVPGQGVPGMGTALGGTWGNRANSLYDLLMQRAGQSLNIDRNDPVIRNQSDNYAAMQNRQMRNYLGDLAERAGPNANISAETRRANESVAQGTSNFEGQLMQHLYDTRNQQILAALSGAQGLLTDQQRMALQEELQQLQLGQQAYQFDQGQQYAYSPFGSGY